MVARVLELLDVQDLDGQEILNRYHFVDAAGAGDEATLVETYIDETIPLMAAIQGTQVKHVAVRHRIVSPTAELVHETAVTPNVVGAISSGDALQSAYALSYKWNLGATVNLVGAPPHIKRGGTRVGGIRTSQVDEDHVGGDVATAAETWFESLQNPGGGVYLLCVVSFLLAGAPPRTGHSDVATQYALVTSASGLAPSTQNTRKVLRGRIS